MSMWNHGWIRLKTRLPNVHAKSWLNTLKVKVAKCTCQIMVEYDIQMKIILISHLHKYSDKYYVKTPRYKLGTPVFGEFLPFFYADPMKLWMGSVGAQLFSSLSRDVQVWLGHSRTFTDLSRSHPCIGLAVCFRSLSCWKLNLHPTLRSWVLWSRFSSRMSLLCSIHISLNPDLSPSSCRWKIMLPPTYFTVGMVLAR